MKIKTLNLILIITSLFGYLEWGADNHSFLFEAEYKVLTLLFTNPADAVHPLTLIPLFGQLLLLVTLFQAKPKVVFTYIGIGSLGLLLGFMLVAGLVAMNYKIILSVLPFIVTAIYAIIELRKKNDKTM